MRTDKLHEHLTNMGICFVLNAINDGWYFFHRISDHEPADGRLYPDKLVAIEAAAEFYGVILEQRPYHNRPHP